MPFDAVPASQPDPISKVSPADRAVIEHALATGCVAAYLFTGGDFNEDGFLFYGQLERLCELGLLDFERMDGDAFAGDDNVMAVFTPAPEAVKLAA